MFDKIETNPMKKEVFYHRVEKYDNGYSASIICHKGSYGNQQMLFEVGILNKNGDFVEEPTGWLDFAGVANLLEKVRNMS